MPMSIKKIVLQASQANFADLSVMPNFATGIQKLEGTVLGLSSKENSRAKIDIHGSVDEFAPVSHHGRGERVECGAVHRFGHEFSQHRT